MTYKDGEWGEQAKERYYKRKRKGYWKKHLEKIKARAIMKYGGVCKRCGFGDIRALQIDHVSGDGNEERKRFKNSTTIYRHLIKNEKSKKYQVLCANCNWIKRVENNEMR